MNFNKKLFVLTAALFLSAVVFAAEVKVVSVTGKCEYEKNGEWVALQVGQVLDQGTKIQTGFKSELVLTLTSEKEDSKMTIAQLSRMTISQLVSTEKLDKTNVYMDTGSVKAEINKNEDSKVNFTVTSPYATASVRGTILTYRNVVGGVSVVTERGHVAVWTNDEDVDDEEEEESSEEVVEEESEEETEVAATDEGDGAEVAEVAEAEESAVETADVENSDMSVAEVEADDQEVVIPSNASEVRQNQEVQVSNTGSVKGTLEVASGKTQELATVSTAAEEETVSLVSTTSSAATVVNETPSYGNISVRVNWE